jgi:hypothetical protein
MLVPAASSFPAEVCPEMLPTARAQASASNKNEFTHENNFVIIYFRTPSSE